MARDILSDNETNKTDEVTLSDILNVGGQTLKVGSQVVGGIFDVYETNKTKEEALKLAELNKSSWIEEQEKNIDLEKQGLVLKKRQMLLEEFINNSNLRLKYLKDKIREQIELRENLYDNFINVREKVVRNKEIRNALIKLMSGG